MTPDLVHRVHARKARGGSNRQIATELGISEATVRRALRRDPTPAPAPRPERKPILLSHPLNRPSPCPEPAPAWCRRLYASLVQRDLLSELDALIVFHDLDVPRCHLTLNVFATDVLLGRIAALPEAVDLAPGIERLREAFAWDGRLREWCRQVTLDAGV